MPNSGNPPPYPRQEHYLRAGPYTLPLVATVKHWALNAGILNSPNHFLSSHAVCLLVIHFLQQQGLGCWWLPAVTGCRGVTRGWYLAR